MADGSIAGPLKVCTKCGEAKPRDCFNKKLAGLTSQCRDCRAEAKRDAWAKGRDETNARRRAARAAAPDRLRQQDKARYQRDRERRLEQRAGYLARNREATREQNRAYYRRNREARIQAVIKRTKAAPERKREYQRRSYERQKSDPKKRLNRAVSAYVHSCLRRSKAGKRWEGLVGYSLADLIRHLERQFTKGMSWENYGTDGWHIDHIVPVTAFSFSSPDDPDFRACWALSNLRPMWAADNVRKSNKRLVLV